MPDSVMHTSAFCAVCLKRRRSATRRVAALAGPFGGRSMLGLVMARPLTRAVTRVPDTHSGRASSMSLSRPTVQHWCGVVLLGAILQNVVLGL